MVKPLAAHHYHLLLYPIKSVHLPEVLDCEAPPDFRLDHLSPLLQVEDLNLVQFLLLGNPAKVVYALIGFFLRVEDDAGDCSSSLSLRWS